MAIRHAPIQSGCTAEHEPQGQPPRNGGSSGSKALDRGLEGQNKGLMDMQGDTWEGCLDKHRSNYEDPAKASPFPEQEQQHRQESLALDASVSRVLRGGSFISNGRIASASYRILIGPTITNLSFGFRVARALKGKP
jgi:formylglycine-generating enzyme required for sulfatase activity